MRKQNMKLNTIALALMTFAALLGTANAHHAFTMFDQTRTETITGTIKTFEWVNPHAWIWVAVPNADGSVDVYGLETAGTGMLRRMGIVQSTFKPGDKVSMDLHPLKTGEKGGEWIRARMADGTVLDVEQLRKAYSEGNQ
jgi:hypothetical protein